MQRTTDSMGGTIQRQHTELSDVSVEIAYSPVDKHLLVTNTGRSDLVILGYQFDGRRGPKFKPPEQLPHGESYTDIPATSSEGEFPDWTYKDEIYDVPIRIFLKKADGTEYTAETILSFSWLGKGVHVSYGATFLKRHDWTVPRK